MKSVTTTKIRKTLAMVNTVLRRLLLFVGDNVLVGRFIPLLSEFFKLSISKYQISPYD